jgi:Fe-S cluster assembly protein SufD
VVEEGAALQLAQSVVSLSHNPRPSLMNSHTRLMLGPGARLDHLYMQELSHESRLLEVVSADVPGSAHYALTALQMGARVGRVNAHINLNAPNANCTLNGVFLAHAQQSLDLHSSIDHRAAATTSRQYQRNVVGDRGEAVFKGRIRIPEVAVKADSEQLCRTLMLGERARVVAMPTLEITADDITCSHGAAICDLDENAMFYLSSRGINRNEARKLLLRSFVLELLQGSLLGPAALERVIKKLESMNPETDGVDSLRKFESM